MKKIYEQWIMQIQCFKDEDVVRTSNDGVSFEDGIPEKTQSWDKNW